MENLRHLKPPPAQAIGVKELSRETRDLISSLAKCLRIYVKKSAIIDDYLAIEVHLIKVFLEKGKHRFRNDKGYHDFRILHRSLIRLSELDPTKLVKDFESFFPTINDIRTRENGQNLYLPTRQMSQFLAVRLHGAFMLLDRISSLCEMTFTMARFRVRLGHFWTVALNFMGCISRIWSLVKVYMHLITRTYSILIKVVGILPGSEVSFLQDNHQLPDDLMSRLANARLREEIEKLSFKEIENILKGNEKKSPEEKLLVQPDIGEVISREDVANSAKRAKSSVSKESSDEQTHGIFKPKEWKKIFEAVERISCPDDAETFLESENRIRKSDRKKAVTKRLEQKQWKRVRAKIEKKILTSEKRKEVLFKDVAKVRESIRTWIIHEAQN